MSFLQLVQREMQGSLPRLLFMSALGGISTAAVLASINAGVQSVNSGHKPSLWAATLFLVALFLFMKTQAYVTITATAEIEGIIHRLRLRIMDQIRRSELLALDSIGRARIVAAVTGDTQVLTQASNMLCFTVQGAVLIFFVSFYVAYLSLAAFVMTFVIVLGAGIMFHMKNHRLSAQKAESAAWERRLFDRLTDFLDGFKEVRLNSARSADLFEDAVDVSRIAANIKIRTQAETFKMIVNSQISMYVLLGAVVFVAPTLSDSLGGVVDLEGDDRAVVRGRRLFRPGAIDSDPAQRQCRGEPHRRIGNHAAGGRPDRGERDRDTEAFREDRNARHHLPLRRQILRRCLQDRTDRLQLCSPASWCSSPAATVRANRRSCACCPGSIRPIPARSRSTGCASTTITAIPIAR